MAGNTWAKYTPEQRADRAERVRQAQYRGGIDTLIGKLIERRAYLTNQQRAQLLELAGEGRVFNPATGGDAA
jgi:hypothetical protein